MTLTAHEYHNLADALEPFRARIENCRSRREFDEIMEEVRSKTEGVIPQIVKCGLIVPVTRDGKLILLERSAGCSYMPNALCYPGGQKDRGRETSYETAIREAEEEMGIQLSRGNLLGTRERINAVRVDGANVPEGRRAIRIYDIWAFDGVLPMNSEELSEHIKFNPNNGFYEHQAYWMVGRGAPQGIRVPFDFQKQAFGERELMNLPDPETMGRFTGRRLREWTQALGEPAPWHWPLSSPKNIPVGPEHPGSFGAVRKYDVHTGVDLYSTDGAPVFAVEVGKVVNIEIFTGPRVKTPWWHETYAVLVEGPSGVVLYGELYRPKNLKIGQRVEAGQPIGKVKQVLKTDKGRNPLAMLHLELNELGVPCAVEVWEKEGEKPCHLLDPTQNLLTASTAHLNS